jgi:hypothetical protein
MLVFYFIFPPCAIKNGNPASIPYVSRAESSSRYKQLFERLKRVLPTSLYLRVTIAWAATHPKKESKLSQLEAMANHPVNSFVRATSTRPVGAAVTVMNEEETVHVIISSVSPVASASASAPRDEILKLPVQPKKPVSVISNFSGPSYDGTQMSMLEGEDDTCASVLSKVEKEASTLGWNKASSMRLSEPITETKERDDPETVKIALDY